MPEVAEPVEAAPPPPETFSETIVENLDEVRERKGRDRGRSDRSRQDRNSDARGAEDRARKTRRNPHGIADMEIGDNVMAFGGFTPAFLLVDPYGGKGSPPIRAIEDEAELADEHTAPAETDSSAPEADSAAEQAPDSPASSSAA